MREDNDIKQEVVARALNVSQATYSRYETGDIEIPVSALVKLAQFHHTNMEYLVGVTEDKTPYTPIK